MVKRLEKIERGSWSKSDLEKCLELIKGQSMLVVGDLGVDRYTQGLVERISPEAPVPIVLVEEEKLKLGLAANVADNVKAVGGIPFLTGVVGEDRSAEDFKMLLKQAGIRASYLVTDTTRRTVLKERVVSGMQQLLRVDYESSHVISEEVEGRLLAEFKGLLLKTSAVILEDYSKGTLTQRVIQQLIETARGSGKQVFVDPHVNTPIDAYLGAFLLTPNKREAEGLAGMRISDPATLMDAANLILAKTRAEHLVVTLGKDGMALFSSDDEVGQVIPTYSREVYDVSGAGDTVISVIALALTGGASVRDAVVLANLAAGVEVSKRGTATVTPDEIRAAMEDHG